MQDSENLQRSLNRNMAALGQKDQEIQAHKEKCELQSNEINELKQTLKQNESQFETLRHEIRFKGSAIADRFGEIAELTRLIELLENNPHAKVKSLLAATAKPVEQKGAQLLGAGTARVPGIKTRVTARKYVKLIENSGLFDAEWYQARHPHLNASRKERNNPALHYYLYGGFEARDPSDKFNWGWYLEQNPDVIESGMNPLIHYILYGKAEGRLPKPTAFYTN